MDMDETEIFKRFREETSIKLIREIASGGMGTVYEGVRLGANNFQKPVAVKTIRPSLMEDEEFVDRFLGEAKLVAKLVHINIVQIYNLGKIGDIYYISMEYVHGINLREFIERHREMDREIPVEMATFIVTRVATALEYAYKKEGRDGERLKVVHRDVCPKNVMISSEGVIKLADFGVAKAKNFFPNREGEILMGKVPYMSPEQVRFEETDHRSDLFSLGTVFHELLSGEQLFDSEQTEVLMEKVKEEPIPEPGDLNREVPERLNEIVMKMLQREPGNRYQDAGTLSREFERFMYEPGFGPTYDKLRNYLVDLFPDIFTKKPSVSESDLKTIAETSTGSSIEREN